MKITQADRTEIKQRWESGQRICEICVATGLPSGSVRNALKRLGVDRSAPRNHVPKVVLIRGLLDTHSSNEWIAKKVGTTVDYVRKIRCEEKGRL